MISYNFKLFIFSIVLGALTLFYNNECHVLYTNIKYKNIVLVQTNLRSLAESSHDLTANDKHENNELSEYSNTNKRKYKKEKYPNDDEKTKEKVPQITNKKFPGTPNKKKYIKEICNNTQGGNSNISPGRLGYLGMQRKLYNDFDGKLELYFRKLSNKSNNKNDKPSQC
ncbi:stevor PIR protein, putative [Plasmodium gaboni]|uniref:Stevor PIR protein, putative n=1 Tax=Plasmodium gaboni TaxID=647221 RepID=A0ABY1UGA6_9APIC|nr:stevor PIR protein, putative [Plasmodium gaboni]